MSTTQSPPTTDGPKRRPPTPRFAARPSAPHRESDLLPQAIARAKAGDAGALHFLYVRFADDVCGYVASIVRDRHEAEDITQTLFLKLLTKIQRYEQREVPFAAWILRVARNAALDHVRARRALPFEDVRTSDAGREDEDFERGHAIQSAPVAGAELDRDCKGVAPDPGLRRVREAGNPDGNPVGLSLQEVVQSGPGEQRRDREAGAFGLALQRGAGEMGQGEHQGACQCHHH